jgi:hypothetical protein
MPWYAWGMVVWAALGSLLSIAFIGRPRDPITPGAAVASVLVAALYIWGIISLAAW